MSGPVIYIEQKSTRPVPVEEMEASPFQEGHTPIPSDAWYTDGCSRGRPAVRTTVAIRPHIDTIWFEAGLEQSSQWVELRATWLLAVSEAQPLTLCTDSWAMF